MKHLAIFVLLAQLAFFASLQFSPCSAETIVKLPSGVRAVWDMGRAYKETTATRQRYCINGLWRWQPAEVTADAVPADGWGYFKAPGCWPGVTNYMQKDCQTVLTHPAWQNKQIRDISTAWYQREVVIPSGWAGRRILISADTVNSLAVVYVDGKKAGEIRFPSGELDISPVCKPGNRVISILVVAIPLKGVMMSYNDTASARQVKGSVERRGLCGDVYLAAEPTGPRIMGILTNPSVRKWEVSFRVRLDGLSPAAGYILNAQVSEGGKILKEFASITFKQGDLKSGSYSFSGKWKPDKLWDIHTPGNQYDLTLSLKDSAGKVIDTAYPDKFGFREFWIDGRDFYLNGTRLFLSSVPIDNAHISAALSTYSGARETMERLKTYGINFVYTHNYGCEPGTHLAFTELLKAADDAGMLVAMSQPHFGQYDWKAADADIANGYAQHATCYVGMAGNHPSVVFYSMSHNATGYSEDMNPDLIDGKYDKRDSWSHNNVNQALRAEAIVHGLDDGRIVYHHSSGNLSSMHTSNFYPNFVPIQEMSDWFGHWATEGVKPVFTCEYSAPCSWDWTMYRGWYKGVRTFGSATVPWEYCIAEWNSQFYGDRAFDISECEKTNLRWEAKQYRDGKLWHRWDYPIYVGSNQFTECYPIFAAYITDNWRAFRTWGVSATSPWEHRIFWKLRDGMNRNQREELKTDWDGLQRPGFSPDYVQERYEGFDIAYERADWTATPAATALIRNNRPLLAYIGGKPDSFTSKDHIFRPGETVEKQIIIVNNTRETVSADCSLPQMAAGSIKRTIATGVIEKIPVKFTLPVNSPAGDIALNLTVKFSTGETQTDSITITVIPQPGKPAATGNIALFDPVGETASLLKACDIPFRKLTSPSIPADCSILMIGKGALTLDGNCPDIRRVRDGLKVVVFEQSAEVLEYRGFRVAEYGLRQVFARVPDHPLLAGIEGEHLRDWRGEATLTPPRLKYTISEKYNMVPTIKWCRIEVPSLWRCGNRGNVASVLIEKPTNGDFLPILDGGYSLQYSPLLEYREGSGMVLFCQLDVSGRTEREPIAENLVRNITAYVSDWKPEPRRTVMYAGTTEGLNHLTEMGLNPKPFDSAKLSTCGILVVGQGGAKQMGSGATAIASWLKSGKLLLVGLDETEANAVLPFNVKMKAGEHIASFFVPLSSKTLLCGIGSADIHNRDPREIPLITSGAKVAGDGVLAYSDSQNVAFLQLAPWAYSGYAKQYNLKRTFRRTSFALSRILGNMGVAYHESFLFLEKFCYPEGEGAPQYFIEPGLYSDSPEDWDFPYRFFRW